MTPAPRGPGAAAGDRGVLCIVLHAHMPYVEGFGTWPFGEEWLWEAIATSYLPLLELLPGRPVTVGLTPVLCDQLEVLAGEAGDRLRTFLREVRAEVHEEDARGLERSGQERAAAELRRAAGDYAAADRALEALGGDLLGAFGRLASDGPAELWAGPATHPVLPLLATDAGRRLQLTSGLAAHERRFGGFEGGMWLPECAFDPGLERDLSDFGIRAFCVDQTDALGLGSLDNLEPVATAGGPVAVPVDWLTVARVWDRERGYPAADAYRDTHRRTTHDRMPWANDGEPYDHARATVLAREHAGDFLDRTAERLEAFRRERRRPGLVCCALDAELLGHWWYEGPAWLEAVLDEARSRGVELASLPPALERSEPVRRGLTASSWGVPKDLTTWDAPGVGDLVFEARAAELRVLAAASREPARDGGGSEPRLPSGPAPGSPPAAGGRDRRDALARAARELMALQASDWSFMVDRDLAGDYPIRRIRGHRGALDAALAALGDSREPVPPPELRNLAPALDLSPLTAP